MLGTREYTLCSPFTANAHNSSLDFLQHDKLLIYSRLIYYMHICIISQTCMYGININLSLIYYSGGSTGGSGGVRTPPPLMGQHPKSRDPTSPDLVHHKCKISYLKFLNKLILLL